MTQNEPWRAEWNASIEEKPKATPDNPVFRNTFSSPNLKNKWVSAAGIFLGLKYGLFEWEKLPKEVQDAVDRYISAKKFHTD